MDLSLKLPDTFLERSYLASNYDTIVPFLTERTEKWAELNGLFANKKKVAVVHDVPDFERKARLALKHCVGNGVNHQYARAFIECFKIMLDEKVDTNKLINEAYQIQKKQNNRMRHPYVHGLFLKVTQACQPKYRHSYGSGSRVVIPKDTVIFYLGGTAEVNAVFINPERSLQKDEKTNRVKNVSLGYFNTTDNAKILIPSAEEINEFYSNLCESENKTPIKKFYKTLEKLYKENQKEN